MVVEDEVTAPLSPKKQARLRLFGRRPDNPELSPAGRKLKSFNKGLGVALVLMLPLMCTPLFPLFLFAVIAYEVTETIFLFAYDPESKYSLRSLILMNLFLGSIVGFIVHSAQGSMATNFYLHPPFMCVAATLAAAIASLVLDGRMKRRVAEAVRARDLAKKQAEEEEAGGE